MVTNQKGNSGGSTKIKAFHQSEEEEKQKSPSVEKVEIADELPILPLPDTVIYPHIVMPLLVTQENLVKLVDEAVAKDRIAGVVTAKDEAEELTPENLYNVGCAISIARMFKLPDGKVQLLVQGIARIRIKEYVQTEPYLKAKVERLQDVVENTLEVEGLARNALSLFQKIVKLAPYLPEEMYIAAMNVDSPNELADFLAANTNLETKQRQEILEELSTKERLKKITLFLNREIEVLEVGSKIQ
ncbi:MAG: LON peptidase substrate-binding domain-containing protein, partial [Actinomycetota bacterium]|nr:LON peptidase substrate-binding domain-containing protein [Actinomycetota bacterium]